MNMRKTFLLAYVVVFLLVGAATAFAATMTVKDATTKSSGIEATLTGVVGSVGDNEFTLTDGTGTIAFECGPSWYKKVDLAAGAEVTVTGEIDKGKTGTNAAELDAFSVTKPDGSTVEIRKGPGKPPWAGARGKGAGKPAGAGAVEDNCGDDKPGTDRDPADKD
jgi:uncharacterized protein YdeI (BOF family)